jgi:ABC-type multidrug transport system fused ATPase/permease subunit
LNEYIGKKIQRAQEITSYYNRKAAQYLYDGLANVKVVKAFGREYYETAQYAARWSSFHKSEYETEVLNFNRVLIQSFFDLFMRCVLLYYLFINITAGKMTVGSIAMLLSYQGMIFGPLSMLSGILASIKRQTQRSKDLMDILREADPLRDNDRATDIRHLQHDIRLDNITFNYMLDQTRPALENCTLTLRAGTTTALVGRSGAGKSTVISLLLRFYDPTTGRILWDGEDFRNFSRKSLHKRVAVVPQDVLIFNRSLRENIAYGDPDLPLSVVIDAAKKAHIHDFIMTLPNQYESIIGENGIQLSGGQKQRVSIARALALNPSLILFDESTSHLDSESELAIQESIASLHHEITQVIVAHRFSTILHADQIVVLDDGKIIGVGTHHELVRNNPVYQKLYNLQFKDDDKEDSKAK